jgi:hypothetical protein
VAAPDGVHATYGRAAEPDVAGLAALSGALRRASYAIVRAPASGPAARAEGDLPLDDDAAEALAADARPALLAIAGVTIGAPVPLRGIDASGVLVTAHVRLIDRKAHKALGQSMVIGGSRGVDPVVVGAAIDRAVVAAVGDVLPRPANQAQAPVAMPSGEDAPIAEPGVVLIRLARATPWGLVQAELKHLIGARGVSSATLRHVSPAGWVIGVATSDSIDRVAAIVKRPPAADLTASVRILGSVVELALAGSTATP